MIVDRFYYNRLSAKEKKIYLALYDGVMERKDIIPVPVKGDISQDVSSRIFDALTMDNPLIYFLNQSVCGMASDINGNLAFVPQYFFDLDGIRRYNKKVQETVNRIAEEISLTEGTDYEKELKVHDWLCSNVQYDFQGSDKSNPTRTINSHNIIGVFAHHSAQCEGIAKAAKVLLNVVDIPCIYVSGKATTKDRTAEHAWNIVNIGGEPYQFDATYDLGAMQDQSPVYDYFNLTDAQISVNHYWGKDLPKCSSRKENYFQKNKLAFDRPVKLEAFLEAGLRKGQRDFVFCYDGKESVSVVSDQVMRAVAKKLAERDGRSVGCSSIPDDAVGAGRIIFR